jgi:hypothetical protein
MPTEKEILNALIENHPIQWFIENHWFISIIILFTIISTITYLLTRLDQTQDGKVTFFTFGVIVNFVTIIVILSEPFELKKQASMLSRNFVISDINQWGLTIKIPEQPTEIKLLGKSLEYKTKKETCTISESKVKGLQMKFPNLAGNMKLEKTNTLVKN